MLLKNTRIKEFFSPAKINLFLKVLRKREDGYHDIFSLFQTVDLFDRLTFSLDDKDIFSSTYPDFIWSQDNLIYKAVELFRKKTKKCFSLRIHLEKNIPIKTGLGGGSSNAATTLFALNQFLDNPVSESTLSRWSKELGADVPFFFSKGRALCYGIGERVKNIPLVEDFSAYLAIPSFGVCTTKAYRQTKIAPLEKQSIAVILQSLDTSVFLYQNDLEKAAFSIEPSLKRIKCGLKDSGFKHVVLTGSGSSFICIGQPKTAIEKDVTIIPIKKAYRKKKDSWYTNI